MIRHPPSSTLFPYTPLFRSSLAHHVQQRPIAGDIGEELRWMKAARHVAQLAQRYGRRELCRFAQPQCKGFWQTRKILDRKSTRLNSSHLVISYAVFCLNKKHFAAVLLGRRWSGRFLFIDEWMEIEIGKALQAPRELFALSSELTGRADEHLWNGQGHS